MAFISAIVLVEGGSGLGGIFSVFGRSCASTHSGHSIHARMIVDAGTGVLTGFAHMQHRRLINNSISTILFGAGMVNGAELFGRYSETGSFLKFESLTVGVNTTL